MRKLFRKILPFKVLDLPVGVSATWRKRGGQHRPYFEFQVLHADAKGLPKIKHFYVGVEPTPIKMHLKLTEAIAFRRAYEHRREPNRS